MNINEPKVWAEIIPAVDSFGETIVRLELYQLAETNEPGDLMKITLASGELRSGPGMIGNARVLMYRAVGLPEHACPHCRETIPAFLGPMEALIEEEKRVLGLRTGAANKPDLITGPAVIDEVDRIRRRQKLN